MIDFWKYLEDETNRISNWLNRRSRVKKRNERWPQGFEVDQLKGWQYYQVRWECYRWRKVLVVGGGGGDSRWSGKGQGLHTVGTISHLHRNVKCSFEVYQGVLQSDFCFLNNKVAYFKPVLLPRGFPGGASGKEPACQCRRHRQVWSLSGEDPLEEGMATHSSILA